MELEIIILREISKAQNLNSAFFAISGVCTYNEDYDTNKNSSV
jgi:hypothetical protein